MNNDLGFTFYSRSEWQTADQPISGPAVKGDQLHMAVAHYTAAPSGVNGDSVQFLRNMQTSYLNDPNRGYSVGYSWFIDRQGAAFQIRGPHPDDDVRYNTAANLGRLVGYPPVNLNADSCAILFPHGVTEPIPQPCIDTAVRLLRWFGFRGRMTPHSTVDPTGCPGDPARAQIAAGLLDVADPLPPPIPPEPPVMETNLVMYSTVNRTGTFLLGAGSPVWLSPSLAEHYRSIGVPKIIGPADESEHWDRLAVLAGD